MANRVIGFALADPDVFTGRPHVFLNAIFGLFGALALIAAAIVLFQSQRADNALTGEDESAIRGLLELYGKNDSLGYFATRRDKSVVFAHSGRAAITYRVEVGVCLASGDPVGDPQGVAAGRRRLAGRCARPTAGRRASWAPVRKGPRHIARPASTRWSWATRPSCGPPISSCPAPTCAGCARR